MRTPVLRAVSTALGVALAACAPHGSGSTPADVLFLRAGAGVTLVSDAPEAASVHVDDAVPSTDWSAVVRAVPRGDRTRVVALDAPSGDEIWSREVDGRLRVEVASEHARMVALSTVRDAGGYAAGRSSTTLVIAGRDVSEARTIELEGNYQPEAFSIDGESLFVVEYLPPRRPTRYRVRRLDLGTEEVVGVYTVDADLQKAMQGTARIQAASRDGRRLYTLYTLAGPDGTMRSFIHVLSLDELWAHCIDLPPEFATGRESGLAIAVAADGGRLYAAEASTGTVAEIDTQTLTVTRTTAAAFGSPGGAAHAAVGADGTLFLAKGTRFTSLDASTLSPLRSLTTPGRIIGIQAANDGERVYVGLRERILVIEAATGRMLPALDPDDVDTIDQLGESRVLSTARSDMECAC